MWILQVLLTGPEATAPCGPQVLPLSGKTHATAKGTRVSGEQKVPPAFRKGGELGYSEGWQVSPPSDGDGNLV